jgi:regulatory protein YycI of two-component signal transduction system YycFG
VDWPKAKSILLIIFIGLNIFLLSSIASDRKVNTVTKEALSNTVKILESKGIKISASCVIPSFEGRMRMLDYQQNGDIKAELTGRFFGDSPVSANNDGSGYIITSGSKRLVISGGSLFTYRDDSLSARLDLSNKKHTDKHIRNYLSDLGFNPFKFILDYGTDSGDGMVYTFLEEYNGYSIFNNMVRVVVSENRITSVSGGYIRVKGFSGSSRKVMPAHQVLLKNVLKLPRAAIMRIDLGYEGLKGDSYDNSAMLTSQSPVWRIVFEDGSSMYFKAYDGEKAG